MTNKENNIIFQFDKARWGKSFTNYVQPTIDSWLLRLGAKGVSCAPGDARVVATFDNAELCMSYLLDQGTPFGDPKQVDKKTLAL